MYKSHKLPFYVYLRHLNFDIYLLLIFCSDLFAIQLNYKRSFTFSLKLQKYLCNKVVTNKFLHRIFIKMQQN